jgi:K+-sensing histidine kinase KdpD
MRAEDGQDLFLLSAGPLAAIALGIVLVPLRGVTVASNFAFAFVALTIAVAEFGGRKAAVATALVSALSLDFFLTQPYLRLNMDDTHDVIAFFGLAVCGLIAAAFGSRRGDRVESLKAARAGLELMHGALWELERTGSLETRLAKVLDRSRNALALEAAVVRDDSGAIVAASDAGAGERSEPEAVQEDGWSGVPGVEGLRIPLRVGQHRVGSLDVWAGGGPGRPFESNRTLGDLARLLGLVLAAR